MRLPIGTQGTRAPRGGHGICKHCGAAVVWFKTDAGRKVPIDHSTCPPADRKLDLSRHTIHWNTCTRTKEDVR